LLPTEITDALGQTWSYSYAAAGNLLTMTDGLGQTTSFTYGVDNRLTSMTDADGNTTNYGYDSSGNLLTTTLPDGTTSTSTFNPLGEPISYVNADGQSIAAVYNADGQITQETFSDGTQYTYTYDAHGNLVAATDASGTTTFTYNAADELTKVSYPNGEFLQFTLDASGRRTQMVDQTGFTVNYQYAPDGQLAGLTDGDGNPIVTYTYNAAGELTHTDNGNGTYTIYTYDADGDVLSVVNDAPDGTANSSFIYTYNSVGEVASMATLDGVWTYRYDADGELIQAVFASTNPAVPSQNQTYTYNAAGDRTSTVINGATTDYTSNSVNEYTSVGGVTYTYDAAGNLISNGTNTYTYNVFGQLTSVTTPTGTTQSAYDALGNLVSATTNGQTTQYLVDPTGFGSARLVSAVGTPLVPGTQVSASAGLGTVVGTYNGSGNLIANYTYGLGLVSQVTPSGTNYYQFDALGSTADLTNSSGAVVNSYAYNPFGSLLASSGTAANPFTFVGQLGVSTDAGGLLQMGFRAYSPALGQFASNDPLGLGGGDTNIRRYVGNNVLTRVDPSGLGTTAGIPGGTGNQLGVTEYYDEAANTFYQITNESEAVLGQLQVLSASSGEAVVFTEQYLQAMRLKAAFAAAEPLTGPLVLVPLGWTIGSAIGDAIAPTPFGQSINNAVNNWLQGILAKILPHDPNDILGPGGYGAQGYVPASQAFSYTVQFQNAATATAPADTVVVTEQLASDLDWSTFQLGDFGFGDIVVQVPPGHTTYQTVVNATASVGVLVDVSANFNPATGVVTWTFTSLDPTTLDVPANPLEGFLPPDETDPEGDGFVSYSVQPKPALTTGTVIPAQASVVFDTNAPVVTPTVTNTIDAGTPTSAVAPLPATSGTSFTVSWSGSDGSGPGIADYKVYMSDDGGPYTIWQSATTATSATFTGQPGHTYAFYSVATDPLGFTQPTPTAAQATTTVNNPPPPTPPTIIGEQVLFTRKLNKKHKPVGKSVLTGFQIDYSAAMNPATAGNARNYQVDWLSTKRVKRKSVRVPHTVSIRVEYSPATDSVDLLLNSPQKFAQGGQITVIASPPNGVESSAGVFLDGNDKGVAGDNGTLTILPKARGVARG
jgi:RHS repeat-associated protein